MKLRIELRDDGPVVLGECEACAEYDRNGCEACDLGYVEIEDVVAVRVRQEPGSPPEAFIEICPVEVLAETERVSIKRWDDWPAAKLASEEELLVHFHGPNEPESIEET